jgi:hypothetical protein
LDGRVEHLHFFETALVRLDLDARAGHGMAAVQIDSV